jgi:hypothetical protein
MRTEYCVIYSTWSDNKVRELILEGLFIMNLNWTNSQPSLLFGVLKRLREEVRRKRPELFANNS